MAEATLTLPGVELPPLSLRFAETVYGLDISTKRIAMGVVQGHGPDRPPEVGWFSLEVEQLGGGARRGAGLLAALPPFLRRIADVAPPVAVLVEQPYGQGKARPHPEAYYTVGITLAVLATEFPTAQIAKLTPGEWKAEAMGAGAGHARKPEILGWARDTLGYPGDCPKCGGHGTSKCDAANRAHDEADALGVATSAAVRWVNAGALLR